MRSLLLLLSASLLAAAVPAHADSFATYYFSASGTSTQSYPSASTSPYTTSGSVTFDTTNNSVASFAATDSLGDTYAPTDNIALISDAASPSNVADFGFSDLQTDFIFANVYQLTFYTIAPGQYGICTSSSMCASASGDSGYLFSFANQVQNATIDTASISATPEPSSLMLLGTGLLGVAGATRRRFRVA